MAQVLAPLQPAFDHVNDENVAPMTPEISKSVPNKTSRSAKAATPKPVPAKKKNTPTKNSVTFGVVVIRVYKMTLGDNPSVSYGAPVQLGWDYQERDGQDLEEYEQTRKDHRRPLRQMVLNYYQRCEILEQAGFSLAEIKRAQAQVNRLKRQRSQTQMVAPTSEVTQAVVAGCSKVRNLFVGRKKKKSKE